MKQLRNVSKVLVVLVLLIGTSSLFVGCPDPYDPPPEKIEYTKEDIKISFDNQSGKNCVVAISGHARYTKKSDYVHFPDVKSGVIDKGSKKDVVVRDVVTSGKDSKGTYNYTQRLNIAILPESGKYESGYMYKEFYSITTEQYFSSRGYFKITWDAYKSEFDFEFINN